MVLGRWWVLNNSIMTRMRTTYLELWRPENTGIVHDATVSADIDRVECWRPWCDETWYDYAARS